MIARSAHAFFNPAHPLHAEYAARINKPVLRGVEAWNVNDFLNLIIARGLQPGDATLIPRLLAAMERAGLLIEFQWEGPLGVFGRRYQTQGKLSAQMEGDLWLCEALGLDLIIDSYNPVTVRISHKVREGSGTGLVLSPIHILTNRHVVEGLAGREVDIINTDFSFERIGADLITHRCRVWGHPKFDLAVIEAEVGDGEGFPPLAGMVFWEPNWGDELYIFGYPPVPGTVDEPITVQPGRVVNPTATAAAAGGYPERKCFLFSAITRPGNSGGPIVRQDGRVIGLVEESGQAGFSSTRGAESTASKEPTFYRGIPGDEVVRAIKELDVKFAGLAVLEQPA
jgi:S1-C subfamily serine protease